MLYCGVGLILAAIELRCATSRLRSKQRPEPRVHLLDDDGRQSSRRQLSARSDRGESHRPRSRVHRSRSAIRSARACTRSSCKSTTPGAFATPAAATAPSSTIRKSTKPCWPTGTTCAIGSTEFEFHLTEQPPTVDSQAEGALTETIDQEPADRRPGRRAATRWRRLADSRAGARTAAALSIQHQAAGLRIARRSGRARRWNCCWSGRMPRWPDFCGSATTAT